MSQVILALDRPRQQSLFGDRQLLLLFYAAISILLRRPEAMKPFPPPKLKYQLTTAKAQNYRLARLALWRSCFVIGCALGVGLAANLPLWKIENRSQIKINDEKLVSEETIHNSLNFSYPQSIWMINGLSLTHKIESIPSIESARVNRQSIPPQIIITLREKTPVAVATSEGKIGFIDASGEWIDRKFYADISDSSLPKLKVTDYKIQFQDRWHKIYQLITLYPELQIDEVQFRQAGNVFLNTQIGRVFLGAKLAYLERQFETIARLKNLPKHLNRSQIDYLDLSDPKTILIQKY